MAKWHDKQKGQSRPAVRGENSKMAKMTEWKVRQLRGYYGATDDLGNRRYTNDEIAFMFRISVKTVIKIGTRKSWKHVK